MSQNRPSDVGILQLRDADFAGKSAIGFVEDVLGRYFYPFPQEFPRQEEVEGGGCYDDFGVRVAGGVVEVGDYFFYCAYCAVPVDRLIRGLGQGWKGRGMGGGVHFEVSADEELARHFGGVV